jgi:hypothetical protein
MTLPEIISAADLRFGPRLGRRFVRDVRFMVR